MDEVDRKLAAENKPVGWVYIIRRGSGWVRAAPVYRMEMVQATLTHWLLLGYRVYFSTH